MAKYEGTQSVPSQWLTLYRGTLNPHPTGKIVKKRYPFKIPKMQKENYGVSAGQKSQRARFKAARNNFRGVGPTERARWYAAEPPWSSFLWYYNYFIMSSLTGNANLDQGGVGVVKSIQYVSKSIPTAGDEAIAITAVDPAKTVVMLFGNSYIADVIQRGDDTVAPGGTKNIALSPSVDVDIAEVLIQGESGLMDLTEGTGVGYWGSVVVDALTTSQLTVKARSSIGDTTINFSWQIIEHKSQTIYPYVKSIAAEAITLSWPVTPSIAATIGAIVIEYI